MLSPTLISEDEMLFIDSPDEYRFNFELTTTSLRRMVSAVVFSSGRSPPVNDSVPASKRLNNMPYK